MSKQPPRGDGSPARPRALQRFALALLAATAVAWIAETWRVWPDESSTAGFATLLAAQLCALTTLWTAPLALVATLAVGALRGSIRRDRDGADSDVGPERDVSRLIWLGPVLLAYSTAGHALLVWSAAAFVRQDLAAAIMPALLLGLAIALVACAALVHRWLAARLARLPRRAVLAAAAVGLALAAIIHVVRFPSLLRDAFIPALIEIAVTGAVAGVCATGQLGPLRLSRRGALIAVSAHAAVAIGLLSIMAYGGRVAPLSYPVASAAVQARGLVAARIARLLAGVGDSDGDGFGGRFGGLDCDDANPAIHPLAKEMPGNGVDDDCFEGDLSPGEVDRDRAARLAERRPPRRRVASVILITVDALRADAVGFASHGGNARGDARTPRLDALASSSAVFTRVFSQAPMTRRAFPALLAGRYPSNIHWFDQQTKYPYPVSHADNLYLAEVARDAGLKTAMVVAFNYAQNSRFDQGFQIARVHPASRSARERNADMLVNDALSLLREWTQAGQPPRFLLWLHMYEPHHPYERHQGACNLGKSERLRYLSEVCWVDGQVGRLIDGVAKLGLDRDTAIVFTGDHGEEFGEHGGQHHGDLYPEDLRVPLLIHVPGTAPARLDVPTGLIDIAPTVLEMLGIPIPESFDGASVLAWSEGEPPPRDRLLFAELVPDRKVPRRIVTAIDGDWQLIVDFRLGARELYDLARDPTAQRNRVTDAPDRARDLEAALRRHMALRVGPLRISRKADESP